MRIFFEERKIVIHGLANVFIDDLGILPSPLSVEMRIADDVESAVFAEIGLGRSLRQSDSGEERAYDESG